MDCCGLRDYPLQYQTMIVTRLVPVFHLGPVLMVHLDIHSRDLPLLGVRMNPSLIKKNIIKNI